MLYCRAYRHNNYQRLEPMCRVYEWSFTAHLRDIKL